MNGFLFEELGFEGSEQVGYQADCCYVNRIVDERKGNPIGLCALYLFMSKRLRLPVTGLGYLAISFAATNRARRNFTSIVSARASSLTKADCVKFLLNASYGMAEGNLSPCTPRKILHRMCNNLIITYGHLEMTEGSGPNAALHRSAIPLISR
jgi:regulator of sirC expression with transglutaminase-like and TPR domain